MSDFVDLNFEQQEMKVDSSKSIANSNPYLMKDKINLNELKSNEELYKWRIKQDNLNSEVENSYKSAESSYFDFEEDEIKAYDTASRKQTRSKTMKKVKKQFAETEKSFSKYTENLRNYNILGSISNLSKKNYAHIEYEKTKLAYNIFKLRTFEKKSEMQEKAIRRLTYQSYLRMQILLDQLRDTHGFNQNSEEYKKYRKEIEDKLTDIRQEYVENAEVNYDNLSLANYKEHPLGQKIHNRFNENLNKIIAEYEASQKTSADKKRFDKQLEKIEDVRNEGLLQLFKPLNKFLTKDSIKIAVCHDTYSRYHMYYLKKFQSMVTKTTNGTLYSYSKTIGGRKYDQDQKAIDRGHYVGYLKPVEFDDNNEPLPYEENLKNFEANRQFLEHWDKHEEPDAFLDQWYKDYISRTIYVVDSGKPSTKDIVKDYKNFIYTSNIGTTFDNNIDTDPFFREWLEKQNLSPEKVKEAAVKIVTYSSSVCLSGNTFTAYMPGLRESKIFTCKNPEDMIDNETSNSMYVETGQNILKISYEKYKNAKRDNKTVYDMSNKYCIKGSKLRPLTIDDIKAEIEKPKQKAK